MSFIQVTLLICLGQRAWLCILLSPLMKACVLLILCVQCDLIILRLDQLSTHPPQVGTHKVTRIVFGKQDRRAWFAILGHHPKVLWKTQHSDAEASKLDTCHAVDMAQCIATMAYI